jgi:hypothetical protein
MKVLKNVCILPKSLIKSGVFSAHSQCYCQESSNALGPQCPEGSLQPSIIPVTKPTNSHRSTIGWGDAGFESGTLGQLLSHQTVQYLLFVELPHLPERLLHWLYEVTTSKSVSASASKTLQGFTSSVNRETTLQRCGSFRALATCL